MKNAVSAFLETKTLRVTRWPARFHWLTCVHCGLISLFHRNDGVAQGWQGDHPAHGGSVRRWCSCADCRTGDLPGTFFARVWPFAVCLTGFLPHQSFWAFLALLCISISCAAVRVALNSASLNLDFIVFCRPFGLCIHSFTFKIRWVMHWSMAWSPSRPMKFARPLKCALTTPAVWSSLLVRWA